MQVLRSFSLPPLRLHNNPPSGGWWKSGGSAAKSKGRIRSATPRNGDHAEVFSPAGILLADVETPVVFRSYLPIIITNDRVLGFIADEDDVLHLVSFRIVRG